MTPYELNESTPTVDNASMWARELQSQIAYDGSDELERKRKKLKKYKKKLKQSKQAGGKSRKQYKKKIRDLNAQIDTLKHEQELLKLREECRNTMTQFIIRMMFSQKLPSANQCKEFLDI